MTPNPQSLIGRINASVKEPGKDYTSLAGTNTQVLNGPGVALNNRINLILSALMSGDHVGAVAATAQLQYQANHCIWNDDGTLNCLSGE